MDENELNVSTFDDDDDDYELEGCPYRHDCNGAGNYMGWCILASGHDGLCLCGNCADNF